MGKERKKTGEISAFARRLKEAMGHHEVTPKALEKQTGLSRSSIQSYIDGTTSGEKHAHLFARVLKVALEWLKDGVNPPVWYVEYTGDKIAATFTSIKEPVPLDEAFQAGANIAKNIIGESGVTPDYRLDLEFSETMQLLLLLRAIVEIQPKGLGHLFDVSDMCRIYRKLLTVTGGKSGLRKQYKGMIQSISAFKTSGAMMDLLEKIFESLRKFGVNVDDGPDIDKIFEETIAAHGFRKGFEILGAKIEAAYADKDDNAGPVDPADWPSPG